MAKDPTEVRRQKKELDRKTLAENQLAALHEAHEDHRQSLGVVLKTAVANGSVFAGLMVAYMTLSSKQLFTEVSDLRDTVPLVGLVAVGLGSIAQILSVQAHDFNAEYGLLPIRDLLNLRRTKTGKGRKARETLRNYYFALLFTVHMLYSIIWLKLSGLDFLNIFSTVLDILKGVISCL